MYQNYICPTCNENIIGSGWLYHRTQKHCSKVPAVVSEEMATVKFTHKLLTTDRESWYKVYVRELLIYFYIYHYTEGIALWMVTDTQLLAYQHLNIICTITSDQTKTSKTRELTHSTTSSADWFTEIRENNFTQGKNNNINMNFEIKIKK